MSKKEFKITGGKNALPKGNTACAGIYAGKVKGKLLESTLVKKAQVQVKTSG